MTFRALPVLITPRSPRAPALHSSFSARFVFTIPTFSLILILITPRSFHSISAPHFSFRALSSSLLVFLDPLVILVQRAPRVPRDPLSSFSVIHTISPLRVSRSPRPPAPRSPASRSAPFPEFSALIVPRSPLIFSFSALSPCSSFHVLTPRSPILTPYAPLSVISAILSHYSAISAPRSAHSKPFPAHHTMIRALTTPHSAFSSLSDFSSFSAVPRVPRAPSIPLSQRSPRSSLPDLFTPLSAHSPKSSPLASHSALSPRSALITPRSAFPLTLPAHSPRSSFRFLRSPRSLSPRSLILVPIFPRSSFSAIPRVLRAPHSSLRDLIAPLFPLSSLRVLPFPRSPSSPRSLPPRAPALLVPLSLLTFLRSPFSSRSAISSLRVPRAPCSPHSALFPTHPFSAIRSLITPQFPLSAFTLSPLLIPLFLIVPSDPRSLLLTPRSLFSFITPRSSTFPVPRDPSFPLTPRSPLLVPRIPIFPSFPALLTHHSAIHAHSPSAPRSASFPRSPHSAFSSSALRAFSSLLVLPLLVPHDPRSRFPRFLLTT